VEFVRREDTIHDEEIMDCMKKIEILNRVKMIAECH
jgi:hypothetical protein